MNYTIEAEKIGPVEITFHSAKADEKRGGYYADRKSPNEKHLLFIISRPNATPNFSINRVEYRWLRWGITFDPATGEAKPGNYQQHGETGHLHFRKNKMGDDYPTDSAINQVTESLLGVIGELSKSAEFKDFALAAIQDSKEKTAKTIGDRLRQLKEYSASIYTEVGNMNFDNCDPSDLLALQKISGDLGDITLKLPKGGTQCPPNN